jgi:hypothetical protein
MQTFDQAVVEGLNILEVVTAERIVAQVSISISNDGPLTFSLAGSCFEGLQWADCDSRPRLNSGLHQPGGDRCAWAVRSDSSSRAGSSDDQPGVGGRRRRGRLPVGKLLQPRVQAPLRPRARSAACGADLTKSHHTQ